MTNSSDADSFQRLSIEQVVDGLRVCVATMILEGTGTPVVFLHGFGSTKEDYADVALHRLFRGRTIIAYDAPGFGESDCANPAVLSVPLLCRIAEAVTGSLGLQRYHLVGHSMGGLTGLLLARRMPGTVASFINIEGNLAPPDCFISRYACSDGHREPANLLAGLIEHVRRLPGASNALYAVGLSHKVRTRAIAPILRSIVELTDNEDLLGQFIDLPGPKAFIYGSQNRALPYLSALRRCGITVAEIPESAHFPMYANPSALWAAIGAFVARCEQDEQITHAAR